MSQVISTSRVAFDYHPSSLRSGRSGFRSRFKKTVSKENPLKWPRNYGPSSPGFIDLGEDGTQKDEGCRSFHGKDGSRKPTLTSRSLAHGKGKLHEGDDENEVNELQSSFLFSGIETCEPSCLLVCIPSLGDVQVPDY